MRILSALLSALFATHGLISTASAQSASDPVETVRAFYKKDDINAVQFYARRLRALYEKDQREAKGEVGRLGFAFHVNGQDTEEKWEKSLKVTALTRGEDEAEVQALFKNFSPQDLRYDMVRENGKWLIADVRSLRKEKWGLVKLLSAPLQ